MELKKAREAAGLSQEEVAARAKISREHLSRLEQDLYSPSVDVLQRICASVGTKAWHVLKRVEEAVS